MKVTKESLIDWFVADDSGKVQAHITKAKGGGYHVALRLFDFKEPYFFRYFKEAKECAIDPSAHVTR
jgi:hypothetical protein